MALSQRVSGVESARKALQLLLQFSAGRPRATVETLARDAGLPTSSAYRYLGLLRELGLVEEGARGLYHVSARIHDLARAADAAGGLIVTIRPLLERLVDETGETAVLIRLLGDVAVPVDHVEPDQPIRLAYSPGRTMPLTLGAPAKLLLASLPATTRSSYLDRMARSDPALAARRDALEAELAAIRERGWSDSAQEVDAGVWGAAAPVREGGRVTASISVAGPLSRLDADRRADIIARTIAAAEEASRLLAERSRPGDAAPALESDIQDWGEA